MAKAVAATPCCRYGELPQLLQRRLAAVCARKLPEGLRQSQFAKPMRYTNDPESSASEAAAFEKPRNVEQFLSMSRPWWGIVGAEVQAQLAAQLGCAKDAVRAGPMGSVPSNFCLRTPVLEYGSTSNLFDRNLPDLQAIQLFFSACDKAHRKYLASFWAVRNFRLHTHDVALRSMQAFQVAALKMGYPHFKKSDLPCCDADRPRPSSCRAAPAWWSVPIRVSPWRAPDFQSTVRPLRGDRTSGSPAPASCRS